MFMKMLNDLRKLLQTNNLPDVSLIVMYKKGAIKHPFYIFVAKKLVIKKSSPTLIVGNEVFTSSREDA